MDISSYGILHYGHRCHVKHFPALWILVTAVWRGSKPVVDMAEVPDAVEVAEVEESVNTGAVRSRITNKSVR